MVDALCTPQPLATMSERIKLTGAYMSIPKKTYIFATGWNTQLRGAYDRVRALTGWTAHEVAVGHHVMLDAPDKLMELLIAAAP